MNRLLLTPELPSLMLTLLLWWLFMEQIQTFNNIRNTRRKKNHRHNRKLLNSKCTLFWGESPSMIFYHYTKYLFSIILDVISLFRLKILLIISSFCSHPDGSFDFNLECAGHSCVKCSVILRHTWRMFRLSLRLITFGGRSAHLAYLVHKSGCKTSIIIIHHFEKFHESLT